LLAAIHNKFVGSSLRIVAAARHTAQVYAMTTTNIEDALNKSPFTPFDIHIDSDKVVHVRHSDFLLFSESKRTAVIVEGERFHIVDMEHISSIGFVSKK
jgi:hypothetical protein